MNLLTAGLEDSASRIRVAATVGFATSYRAGNFEDHIITRRGPGPIIARDNILVGPLKHTAKPEIEDRRRSRTDDIERLDPARVTRIRCRAGQLVNVILWLGSLLKGQGFSMVAIRRVAQGAAQAGGAWAASRSRV